MRILLTHPRLAIALALLLAAAPRGAVRADFTKIEVDSVATEILGTPVAIHRMYARTPMPGSRVSQVMGFDVIVGSPIFHHRDFDTDGALSSAQGNWSPYLVGAVASAGDSHMIIGGNAGPSPTGSLIFINLAVTRSRQRSRLSRATLALVSVGS